MNLTGMDELKVGDRVLVITGGSPYGITFREVSHVTPKQFVTKINDYETRFRKSDGTRLGSGGSWYCRDFAYPCNSKNHAEYEQIQENQRLRDRARDLLGKILVATRKLREEDLEKMEQIAAILEIEEEE